MAQIALTREELVVVVLEDPALAGATTLHSPPQLLPDPIDDAFNSAGDLVYSKGSPRAVLPTANSRWVQRGEFLPDEQLRDIRSELPMIKGRLSPGTWSMTTYVKPYSDAVSPPNYPVLPEIHNLLLCAMGKVTKLKALDAAATGPIATTAIAAGPPTTFTLASAALAALFAVGDVVKAVSPAGVVRAGLGTVSAVAGAVVTYTSVITGFTALDTVEVVPKKFKYTLTNDLPTFSSWVRRGSKQVVSQRGCSVNQLVANVSGNAIATLDFSGEFIEQIITGNSTTILAQPTVSAAGVAEVTIAVPVTAGESRRFMVGGLVFLHKTGTTVFPSLPAATDYEVMRVKAVDYTTDTLTLTRGWIPGVGAGTSPATYAAGVGTLGANPLISAWFPAGPASELEDIGSKPFRPIHGKFGQATADGVGIVILTSRLTLTNNIRYYIDEKNGVLTAETIGTPGRRGVAVSITKYIKAADAREWTDALNQSQRSLMIPCGSTADTPKRIFTLKMPQVEFRSPDVAGTAEFEMTSEIMAMGTTAGNDEFFITVGDAQA